MFTGDFSAVNSTIYDPANKTPFPGNIIPSNRFDPISQKLLKYYAAANIPGNSLQNNFVRSDAAPLNRDGFVPAGPDARWNQDCYELRTVHGIQYANIFARHRQRGALWIYAVL
jgi:hypothetical protein